jgi:hypothetical protein
MPSLECRDHNSAAHEGNMQIKTKLKAGGVGTNNPGGLVRSTRLSTTMGIIERDLEAMSMSRSAATGCPRRFPFFFHTCRSRPSRSCSGIRASTHHDALRPSRGVETDDDGADAIVDALPEPLPMPESLALALGHPSSWSSSWVARATVCRISRRACLRLTTPPLCRYDRCRQDRWPPTNRILSLHTLPVVRQ